ncbi:hypothetical protein DSO57_1019856 [Entomophthora muscae]|uniref:Uncharacterized protein n=1 Tax=Entomophthora muscae TaxID=34485 RepID=A0ACC2SGT2_9FUNG|nr:hypothetical protein DSO57_1019856 [Entomophthora muscae]
MDGKERIFPPPSKRTSIVTAAHKATGHGAFQKTNEILSCTYFWEAMNFVVNFVVNTAIHHILILPLVGHFEDKSLAFAFTSQNELMTESGSTIVWFLDSAQLTCPTHACGK